MPSPRSRNAKKRRFNALADRLERWFSSSQRDLPWRKTYSPYQVWISEVMLQQTRMEVVLPYFRRFVNRFPDVVALAKASEEEVLSAWSGLGYYRRARLLHRAARIIVQFHGSRLPRLQHQLLAIPGIGRYTAGAIASIAFDQPAAIVDGNVARVLARVEAIQHRSGSARFRASVWDVAQRLVTTASSPRVLNQAVMELGALICRPRNPLCRECPVARLCVSRAIDKQNSLPRGVTIRGPAYLEIPLLVVSDRRGNVLMRRHSGLLMSEMFHLPHGNGLLLGSSGSLFRPARYLGSFRHTVTHRRIRFDVWSASGRSRAGFTWVDPSALDQVPHPSYVRKALALFQEK